MATSLRPLSTLLVLLGAWPLPAQQHAALFDTVAGVLEHRLYDRDFCRDELPELLRRYRPAALAAASAAEERGVIHALLAEVPVSHLALLSRATHLRLEAELMGLRSPMVGCALLQLGGSFYVDSVYAGSAAAAAGLRRGDEVLAIDGVPVGQSARLDWRSDDAHLDDPPTHDLRIADGQSVTLRIAGTDGATAHDVRLTAVPWSGLEASRAGVAELDVGGHRVLYVHLWYVFHARSGRLLRDALDEHSGCEALLLDLRGRGGSALECAAVVREVDRAAERGVPTVALVDARTRSAKEVIASDLQRRGIALLVGESTAGAVLPATFVAIDDDAVLMLPESKLGAYSRRLEGHGVQPEQRAADPLPPAPGSDPILAAAIDILEGILGSSTNRR